MKPGLLAAFASEAAMDDALAQLRAEYVGTVETHTPSEPEHGAKFSVMPLIILLCGMLGAVVTFLMETYATVWAYPLDIGGRPAFSWPAYVPMAFEMGVVCAVGGGLFGFLIVNRLPNLYQPIDEIGVFRRASRDAFFVAIRTDDDAAIRRARAVLRRCDPLLVEEIAG